jgi:hypothetical protein
MNDMVDRNEEELKIVKMNAEIILKSIFNSILWNCLQKSVYRTINNQRLNVKFKFSPSKSEQFNVLFSFWFKICLTVRDHKSIKMPYLKALEYRNSQSLIHPPFRATGREFLKQFVLLSLL